MKETTVIDISNVELDNSNENIRRSKHIQVVHLNKYGASSWVSADFYNEATGKIELHPGVVPDITILRPNAIGNSICCPNCLAAFIEKHGADIKVDCFGHVTTKGTPYGPNGYFAESDMSEVPELHWGMSGEVGTCYRCLGCPEEKPIW
jgi:hypothetical protein